MGNVVLDASALLVVVNGEPGADQVKSVLRGAAVSTVNLSETASVMMRVGMSVAEARALLDRLPLEVVPFERTLAYRAAELVAATRTAGLSLGDCACLALAESRQAVAVTSDRAWARIELGIPTQIVR